MSNPSNEAINSINELIVELGLDYGNRSDADVLDALLSDVAANPDPRPQVARIMVESELLSLLNDPGNGSLGKLMQWPNLGLLRQDIKENNHGGISIWSNVLAKIGTITEGESVSINEYALNPIPDPGWRSEIPRIEIIIGRSPDLDDIRSARAVSGGS